MRSIRRVPADNAQPLKHYATTVRIPTNDGGHRRFVITDENPTRLTENADRAEREMYVPSEGPVAGALCVAEVDTREEAIRAIVSVWQQGDANYCVGESEFAASEAQMRSALMALGVAEEEIDAV